MSPTRRIQDLAEEASFIFRGEVIQLDASTMGRPSPRDRTAIVRVESVLLAAEPLLPWEGKDITLHLARREQLREGRHYEFYTHPQTFGDSLAVISLGHRAVKGAAADTSVVADPTQALRSRQLRKHVEEADLIIVGRVSAIRLPEVAGAASGSREHVTSKDPRWREAVVDVSEVKKGDLPAASVVALFPTGRHLVWQAAPSLQPGDEGVFLLHKATADEAVYSSASYTCLHQVDLQPVSRAEDIREQLRIAAASDA
jgi:hypothetical protein